MTELFKIKSPTRINDDASKGERITSSRSDIEISSNEERKENFSDKAFVSANVAFSSVLDDDEFMIKDLSKNAIVPSPHPQQYVLKLESCWYLFPDLP